MINNPKCSALYSRAWQIDDVWVRLRAAAGRSHSRDNWGSGSAASPPSVYRWPDPAPRSDPPQPRVHYARRPRTPSRHTRSVRSPPETHTHTQGQVGSGCVWPALSERWGGSHQFNGQRRGLAPGVCEGAIAVDLLQKTSGHVDAAVERHGADGALRERTGWHVWPPVAHGVVTLDLQHTWWREALNKHHYTRKSSAANQHNMWPWATKPVIRNRELYNTWKLNTFASHGCMVCYDLTIFG